MRCNLALWDRILRFLLGVFLMTFAFAGGPFWTYSGLYWLMSSAWGFCPLYAVFRIQTLRSFHRPFSDEESRDK